MVILIFFWYYWSPQRYRKDQEIEFADIVTYDIAAQLDLKQIVMCPVHKPEKYQT